MLYIPQTRQPTWKSGFARSGRESAHPELWKGLVGAWAPGLGPTGLVTLKDVSARKKNDGVFTATINSSDFFPDDGRYTVDLPGVSSPNINLGTDPLLTGIGIGDFTLLIWINTTTNNSDIISNGVSTAGKFLLQIDGSDQAKAHLWTTGGSGITAGTSNIGDGAWHLIGQRVKGTVITVWVDGQEENSAAISGTKAAATSQLDIGSRGGASPFYTGLFDDCLIYSRGLSDSEMHRLWILKRGGIFQRRPIVVAKAPAAVGGRIMSSLTNAGGLAGVGGIAGTGGGLAG